jgi:hypothetical protein
MRHSAPVARESRLLFPVLAHVDPAIFLHGGGEKRRIVIRKIEADELGFELPLQYLDQLASKIAE